MITDEPGTAHEGLFEPYSDRSRKVRCTVCGAFGTATDTFRARHLAGHPYTCPQCPRVFTSSEGRANHRRAMHERDLMGPPRPALVEVEPEPEPVEPQGSSTHQVAKAAGVSYRRIDYWVRRGYLTPDVGADGSGTQRVFGPAARDRAVLLTRLIRAGVVVDVAAAALDEASAAGTVPDGGVLLAALGPGITVVIER